MDPPAVEYTIYTIDPYSIGSMHLEVRAQLQKGSEEHLLAGVCEQDIHAVALPVGTLLLTGRRGE